MLSYCVESGIGPLASSRYPSPIHHHDNTTDWRAATQSFHAESDVLSCDDRGAYSLKQCILCEVHAAVAIKAKRSEEVRKRIAPSGVWTSHAASGLTCRRQSRTGNAKVSRRSPAAPSARARFSTRVAVGRLVGSDGPSTSRPSFSGDGNGLLQTESICRRYAISDAGLLCEARKARSRLLRDDTILDATSRSTRNRRATKTPRSYLGNLVPKGRIELPTP